MDEDRGSFCNKYSGRGLVSCGLSTIFLGFFRFRRSLLLAMIDSNENLLFAFQHLPER